MKRDGLQSGAAECAFRNIAPLRAMPSSVYFGHNGKCAANFRNDELDMNSPKELLNLDVLHKRSTARNVEQMPHGRFGTAPRTFFGDPDIDE